MKTESTEPWDSSSGIKYESVYMFLGHFIYNLFEYLYERTDLFQQESNRKRD